MHPQAHHSSDVCSHEYETVLCSMPNRILSVVEKDVTAENQWTLDELESKTEKNKNQIT